MLLSYSGSSPSCPSRLIRLVWHSCNLATGFRRLCNIIATIWIERSHAASHAALPKRSAVPWGSSTVTNYTQLPLSALHTSRSLPLASTSKQLPVYSTRTSCHVSAMTDAHAAAQPRETKKRGELCRWELYWTSFGRPPQVLVRAFVNAGNYCRR
jgi:hypothetical protein